MVDANNPFNCLIGKELSSIEFVRDYIQFRFDGPCITAITDPFIFVEGQQYNRSNVEFCNNLLSFINLSVVKTHLIANKIITIEFSHNRSINISLNPNDYKGNSAEAVNFDIKNGGLWVY